jgi:hypothetical protein
MLEGMVPLSGTHPKILIVRIGPLERLRFLRSRVLPLLALGLLLLLAVWVVLAPAESRLGNVVKLVFVHGALVWVGLFTFSAAGLLGLVALAVRHLIGRSARATTWYLGTEAASLAALIVWGIYVVSAMVVTGLTWGQLVAWNEPRVRVTGLILVAAVVLFVVARLVNHADFTAVVNLLLGIVPWVMVQQADVIRHPVDPIGGSGSTAIQGYYLLIQLTVAALAATLVAWLWVRAVLKERD